MALITIIMCMCDINDDNDYYDDNNIDIYSATFDKDYDDISFEPTLDEGDDDEENKELFGF